jgi:DNA polymerase-3 subunit delta
MVAVGRANSYTQDMAANAVQAVDFLAHPEKHSPRAVCAVFGEEAFFRRQVLLVIRKAVLGDGEGNFSLSTFSGRTVELRDVLDELATVAMFGGGKRLVVVDEADDFVSWYRQQLEDYAARPAAHGVLVLEMKKLPANTRLYKAVAADGLAVNCGALSSAQLTRWLSGWAKQAHDVCLSQAAAEMLLEMIGPELGLLDQELGKLSLTADAGREISPETITQSPGSWRAKTTWEMLDAALAGNLPRAVTQLDRLLASGESPIGLLSQISASLRRLAAAARLVLQPGPSGRPLSLRAALEEVGVRSFFLAKSEQQLRHLGRERAGKLYRLLLQADLDLKGASALPPRLVLERLVVQLAGPKPAVKRTD